MAGVTRTDLMELMGLMVTGLKNRMADDIKDNIPTDAATYGVVTKLLKDNDVLIDPADVDDLASLREKLTEQSKARRLKASNVVAMIKGDDKQEAYG